MPGHAALSRLWRRVGRRGASLLFVGVLSGILSASIALAGPLQASSPSYVMLSTLAPLSVWATCWGTSMVVCWVQAFMKQDRVAFALATAMWWLYGLANITGFFTGVNPRGWVSGLLWLGFGGWINLIATWPEVPPPPRKEREHADDS